MVIANPLIWHNEQQSEIAVPSHSTGWSARVPVNSWKRLRCFWTEWRRPHENPYRATQLQVRVFSMTFYNLSISVVRKCWNTNTRVSIQLFRCVKAWTQHKRYATTIITTSIMRRTWMREKSVAGAGSHYMVGWLVRLTSKLTSPGIQFISRISYKLKCVDVGFDFNRKKDEWRRRCWGHLRWKKNGENMRNYMRE